jgi:hypothetical protein
LVRAIYAHRSQHARGPASWPRRRSGSSFYNHAKQTTDQDQDHPWTVPRAQLTSRATHKNHAGHRRDDELEPATTLLVRVRTWRPTTFGSCGSYNVCQMYIQKDSTGAVPSDVQIYLSGHRGSDPANPDVLCSQKATDHLVSVLKCLVGSVYMDFCM